MKVFLTGVSGFLGSHISEILLENKISLKVLVNKTPIPKFLNKKNLSIVNDDLLNVESFKKEFNNFDYIIHTAASVLSDKKSFELNVIGTRKLAECAIEMGVKNFIFTSTRSTIGISNPTTLSSENSTNFENFLFSDGYIDSKRKSENDLKSIFKDRKINYYCICPTALVGSRDIKPTPIGKFVNNIVENKVKFFIDGYINIIDVRSAADLFVNILLQKVPTGKYGLGQHNIELSSLIKHLIPKKNKTFINYPKKIPKFIVELIKLILYFFPVLNRINPFFSYKKIVRLQKGYSCFESEKIYKACNFKKINLDNLIKNLLSKNESN
jgi:dihydroflavonol-4-reductase